MLDLDDQLTFVIHMQLQELVGVFQCDSSVRFRQSPKCHDTNKNAKSNIESTSEELLIG